MHHARVTAALLTLSLLGAIGCSLAPTFSTSYESSLDAGQSQPIDAALAVQRFVDQRPPRVYSTAGRVFLTYVPLLPYVSMPFERLDESVEALTAEIKQAGATTVTASRIQLAPEFEQYTYPASVARAIAEDLGRQGVFREVKYVGDAPVTDERYVLKGVLRESPLEQSVTSYCLGMPGVLLWLIPIPIGKVSAEMNVDLTLADAATGKPIWTHTLDGRVSRIFTLYTSGGVLYGTTGFSYQMVLPPSDSRVDRHSIFAWHFEALRRGMEEARPSLLTALATQEVNAR